MGFKFTRPRINSPYWQNVLMGSIVGASAGLYGAINLLGAGGGKPNSASTAQVVNATLCSVWFFSANFGGTVLNNIGPAITVCLGVIGYILYVGSLFYFDQTGKEGFPIFAGVAVGISAGFLYVSMGYIAMSYSEENNRGRYIAMVNNLTATGIAIGGIIPLIINRDQQTTAGVPTAVYVIFMVIEGVAACVAYFLLPPNKVIRDDGAAISVAKSRGFVEELRANLEIFRDWKLLIMIPAFLPSECFLVYGGSVNAYHNNLRTRSLLSFIAPVLQIPASIGLRMILDHEKWKRRTRALLAIFIVGVPMTGSWIWEIVRVRNFDRSNPPLVPMDWSDDGFVAIFFAFMLNWVSNSLWQIIIYYFLGAMTNSPPKAANYAGVYRGFLAAGEAICFGVDSLAVPYIKEAGVLFAFYSTGILVFLYLALFQIEDTKYFTEAEVIIPKHVLAEHNVKDPSQDPESADQKTPEISEMTVPEKGTA
ncbi:hypothetical protein B7463_g9003, partial [Scytalidium lignicola]